MPLFSKREQDELILILDVQSSIVRGTLVMLHRGGTPNVIFTYNANIPWKPHTDSSYLIKVTLRSVSETIEACMRNLHIRPPAEHIPKKISAVHYALSSPWIVSQAKTLTTTFTKPVQVTEAYVHKIIEDERLKMASGATDEVTLIEQKIFDVRLNGYSIVEWAGKTATIIDVSYTMSVAGTRMIERFRDACSRVIHEKNVYFHSSLLLQFSGMRTIMPERGSFALIHIHGELSDVAIMDNNSCVFFGSYPFGVHTLVRKIAQSTNTDLQAADSLLTLYIAGHMDESHGKSALEAVHAISIGWISDLKKLLATQSLPPNILISALAHDDFYVHALAEAYPRIHIEPLSIDEILPHVAFGERTERRRLTGLYAIAINVL